jgi:hypothetical protein
MALFDRTAKHLAAGPTLLVPSDRVDDVTELLRRYDPGLTVKSDRFFFDNGVFLYGPVETAEPGMVGYSPALVRCPKRVEWPEDAKLLDGERLVRGLAVRLGAATRSERPWAELGLEVSVYAETPLPAEEVIGVLQPYAGDEDGRELVADEQDVEESYILVSEREPVFLTVFWPNYLSRSRKPPLAVRIHEPCRWQLRTTSKAATADPALCRLIAEAALALAAPTNGVVVDMYGFPVTKPDELLPS